MMSITHLQVLSAVARHGSVTAAAKELHYTQPSISHHLARLEAATGTKLVQRVGRGIRLTPEGQLLASRATEIVGRVDAAAAELAAQVGLCAGRVRLAGFQSVLSTIVPRATESLTQAYPGIEVSLVDAHPGEAMRMLRAGAVDVALIFRYADTPVEDAGFRLVHVAEDPIYLVSREPGRAITDYRDSAWIGGCERCQYELINICQRSGFTPRIAYISDDMVVMQALVAAGMGVATLPGLALRAHRAPGIHTAELPDVRRQIHAVTFGDPPDPPATSALIQAIQHAVIEEPVGV
jgi:DNA-binding transcriptional LysR family regulator